MKSKITTLLATFFKQPDFVVKINWVSLLFYLTFLCYGYLGILTTSNFIENFFVTGILVLVQIFFGIIALKKVEKYKDQLVIPRIDLLVFLLFLLFFGFICFEDLSFSLVADELAYTKGAFNHSLLLSKIIISKTIIFDEIPYKYLIQIISLILIISLTCLYYLTKKLSWHLKIIIFVILLIICRIVIGYLGGNPSPHPPINLFPLILFGSLFGLSNFSMKVSFLFFYTIFIYFFYRILLRKFNFWQAILITLSIATIPLLLRLGTTVEQSLWTSLVFIFVLLYLITTKKVNTIRLIAIVSIATMIRLPTFLVLIPIILLYFWDNSMINKKNWKQKIYLLLPVLFFLPFLLHKIVIGTPATNNFSEIDLSITDHFFMVFETKIIWISILNSIDYLWIPFMIFAFIPLSKNNVSKNIAFFLFFVSCIFLYYAIRPALWGEAKYQTEIIIPFIVVGYTLLLIKSKDLIKKNIYMTLILLFFNGYNFYKYSKSPEINLLSNNKLFDQQFIKTKKLYYGFQGHLNYAYNYNEAFEYILNENLANNSISIGITYGIIPEILSGYSTKNIRNISSINYDYKERFLLKKLSEINYDTEILSEDDRVKIVVLGMTQNKAALTKSLTKNKWRVIKEFKNENYLSSVVVLKQK